MGFGLEMYGKGIMTRAAIAIAILLFLINPVVHQHRHTPIPECGSMSAPTGSSMACSVCRFQTNVAVQTATDTADAPFACESSAFATPTMVGYQLAVAIPSRAPPAIG